MTLILNHDVWSLTVPSIAKASEHLLNATSLTAYLSQQGSVAATILALGVESSPHYVRCLPEPLLDDAALFRREIFLTVAGEAQLWACSLCSPKSLFWRDYLDCGSMPLGRKLFNGEDSIERGVRQFALLDGALIPDRIAHLTTQPTDRVIARHTYYHHHNDVMSLLEIPLRTYAVQSDI